MSKTTKEDILIVALHLFARDGYEAVSVSQIAGELGMTKGALYRFLRIISWNTVNLCFRIGQKMILHHHFERCLH